MAGRAPLVVSHAGAFEINPDPYNLQDLGISLDLAFSGSDGYPTTLQEIVAQNLPCDLAYTSGELEYASLTSRGTFLPLDDLVNNFAPNIFMMVPKGALTLARPCSRCC